jgi:hypothetical protein
MRRLLAIAAFFFILAGCTKDNPVESASSGSFQYMAYDTTGTPMVSGWMTINIQDSTHVTGEWHFNKLNNPLNIGPQTGEGNLIGLFDNGQLHINLNPDYIDNNVFLIGKIQAVTYSGTWNWSGYPGLINRGNFQATRQLMKLTTNRELF